jgi:hypothetical protein
MTEATSEERVQLSSRLRHRTVGDEGVLVHLENGRVLVVNEVGNHCVQALGHQPMTVAELADSVVREFAVDADQARADVAAFLDQLRAEQALEITGPDSGDRPAA